MFISPTNNIIYNTSLKPRKNNSSFEPSFSAGIKSAAVSEIGLGKIEYAFRIVGNKIASLFESKNTKKTTLELSNLSPQQNSNYLDVLNSVSRIYSTNKTIDVNIEDKIIERIAQKGKSVIFIMNHSNQSQDPSMLAVLNTILIAAYKKVGNVDNFPLPKIVLNKDILETMSPTKRKAFETFGAVGIDANLHVADKNGNAKAFLPIMRDFIKDKCNIFIFPEGRLALRKDIPLEQRFQEGVAEIVNKMLGFKKEITVVPVGFSYGKGKIKDITGLQIGDPITFTRDKEVTKTTVGSILKSKYADPEFVNFFNKHKNEENIIITENGKPVNPKNVTGYIKSLLSENLNICSLESKDRLLNSESIVSTF